MNPSIRNTLAGIVGSEGILEPSEFRMGDVVPSVAVAPGSAEEIAEVVQLCLAEQLGCLVLGGMSRARYLLPPKGYALALSTTRLRGCVECGPQDGVATLLAGTSLQQAAEALAPFGQWLPWETDLRGPSTIGGAIATNQAGPLADAFGPPRQRVLEVKAVTGLAEIVRVGARVTKHQAGYGIQRLLCGSWGALGIIVEATVATLPFPLDSGTHAVGDPPTSPHTAQSPISEGNSGIRTPPLRRWTQCVRIHTWQDMAKHTERAERLLPLVVSFEVLVRNGDLSARYRAVADQDAWPRLQEQLGPPDPDWPQLPICSRGIRFRCGRANVAALAQTLSEHDPDGWIIARPLVEEVLWQTDCGDTTLLEAIRRAAELGASWHTESGSPVAPAPVDEPVARMRARVIAAFDPHNVFRGGLLGSL